MKLMRRAKRKKQMCGSSFLHLSTKCPRADRRLIGIHLGTIRIFTNERSEVLKMTESLEIREFLEKVDGTVEQVVSHIEVLDKVKHLLTIPGTDTMTTRQVADYYGVEIDTVRRVYQRHKAEIDSDGTAVKKAADFLTEHEFQVEDADRLTGREVTLGSDNVRTEQTVRFKNSDSNVWAGQSVQSKGSRDVRTGQSVHVKNRNGNVWTEQGVQSKVEDMLTEPKVQLGEVLLYSLKCRF